MTSMWELLCLLQPKATNAAHKQETKMMKQADKHMHQALIWGKVCLQASVRANILQQAMALIGTQTMASSMCKPSNSHSRSPSRTSPEKMSLNATFASRSWRISWIVWRGFNSDLIPKIVGICKTTSEPHFLQSSKPSNNHLESSLRTSPERMSLNAAFASRSWLMSWIVWGGLQQ